MLKLHKKILCLYQALQRAFFLIGLISVTFSVLSNTYAKAPFTINDYFELTQITELALSSNGKFVAYAVTKDSLEENKKSRQVFIREANPTANPIRIESLQSARSITWIPGRNEVAFLSSHQGTTQVFSYDLSSSILHQHTHSEEPVIRFQFSPDGKWIAYLTQNTPLAPSLYQQFQTGEQGVVVDPYTTSLYDFVDPNSSSEASQPDRKLWLSGPGQRLSEVNIPGQVNEFDWSPNSDRLSILYVDDNKTYSIGSILRTSIGVFNLTDSSFRLIAAARPPSEIDLAQYFRGGSWIPGETKIVVRRIVEHNVWDRHSEWALIDLADESPLDAETTRWHEIEFSFFDELLPVHASKAYVNMVVGAVRSLYEVSPTGLKAAQRVRNISGSVSSVAFSADFETIAYVNQSLVKPPEIYVQHKDEKPLQLTHFNDELAARKLPNVREIQWKSSDGEGAQGWLLEPPREHQVAEGPSPMIIFVHGGPGLPMPNEFAFYFSGYGGIWPYPFEAIASAGIAVFIPNYRGTRSFGRKFAGFNAINGEAVDDILSGIQHLVDLGVADPGKLGIAGHSHGGWLGPLVMSRFQSFVAGAFAEGPANMFVNYAMMTHSINKSVHDEIYFNGSSLYDNPLLGVEQSSVFQFNGLRTAVLFEAGAFGLGAAMLDHQKAAIHYGMPTEYVVYPKTGHNILIPALKKESAERNLDWFRFWILDLEDSDPAKRDQYRRWRALRER